MRATAMAKSVCADRYCAAGSLLKTRNAALHCIALYVYVYVMSTYGYLYSSLRDFYRPLENNNNCNNNNNNRSFFYLRIFGR